MVSVESVAIERAPLRRSQPRMGKFGKWLVATSFFAPTATATLIGVGIGLHQENSSNAHDVQKAQGYERCITFSQALSTGRVVLHASEVPRKVQTDCGVARGIDDVRSAVRKGLEYIDQDVSLDGEVSATVDPVVTIPSISALEHGRDAAYQASRSTGITEPAFLGISGALIGMVAIVGATEFGERLEKRNSASQPC